MTLTSKDEYLKASSALATGFGPTQDFADLQRGTTSQSEGGIPTSASDLPGQVFTVDQLPDPAAAVAYGLPPVTVPAHLILDEASDGTKHVQGKDVLDVLTAELRKELGDPMLSFDNTIRSQDDALTSFTERTGGGEGVDNTEAFVDGIKGGDGESTTGSPTDDAPIDPEGVQKGDGDDQAVSAAAGTQGKTVPEAEKAGPDAGKDQPSAKAVEKTKAQQHR